MPKAAKNIKAQNLTLGIRLFLFLLIGYSLFSGLIFALIQYILDRGLINLGGPPWTSIRVIYQLHVLVVVFFIASTVYFATFLFYNRVKILGVVSVFTAFVVGVLSNILLNDWNNKINYLTGNAVTTQSSYINFSLPFVVSLPFLFPLILFLGLNREMAPVKVDKYHSKKLIALGVYSFLFTFIPIVAFTYINYVGRHPTYNYQKIQKTLDYHLYFPTQLPKDKALILNFDHTDHKNMTWVKNVIGSPNYLPITSENPGIMILYQTKMPPIFNLKRFAQDQYASYSATTKPLQLKEEFTEYVLLKNIKRPDLSKVLLLLTKQNTLIEIAGVVHKDEDYVYVANGLQ